MQSRNGARLAALRRLAPWARRPSAPPAKARKSPVGTNYKPMNRADVAAFIPPSTCISAFKHFINGPARSVGVRLIDAVYRTSNVTAETDETIKIAHLRRLRLMKGAM